MPSLLPRTEKALEDYQDHLMRYPDTAPEILSYLVRHINGLMCGEIEQEVTRLVIVRLQIGCRDEESANFFPNFLQLRRLSSIRNATVGEIRDTLSAFDPAYRGKFDDLVRQNVGEDGVQKLLAAVRKRNDNAHHTPPIIDFQEVEATYRVANQVVEAVRVTLEN